MKRTTYAVVAVIALVLTAGAAAGMPGSAPDNATADDSQEDSAEDAPDDAADDARDEDADDARDDDAAEASGDDRADAADDPRANATSGAEKRAANAQGPSVDLPSQVPDHVHKIHDVIGQFLDGELDGSLGDLISGIDRSDAANESAEAGGA